MKHVIPYQLWEAYRFKESNPIQQEFMKLFLAKCDELGIQVDNLATELQKNNNTWIINLAPSDVLKLFLESGWQQWTEGIRKGKAERLMKDPLFNLAKPAISKLKKPTVGTAHWIISNDNVRQMIQGWHGATKAQHSSQRNIIFSEVDNVEEAIGLFYNQLTLVSYNLVEMINRFFERNYYINLLNLNLFDSLSFEQIRGLMKKYPEFSWNEVFAKADLPQSTFKEVLNSPEASDEMKHRAFNNPNYADYDKVEDILGDWMS